MANPAFRLHGAGCGLADLLVGDLDSASPRLAPYRSRRAGDGGLELGKVVFHEDLVRFAGRPFPEILADLSAAAGASGRPPALSPGGPALVAMTLASQLLKPERIPATYYGLSGDDAASSRLRFILAQTPLDMTCYRQRRGTTPCTHVFSDPGAQDGNGDRFFVHEPGTVVMTPELLGEGFFQATFNLYAGTALVPGLHAVLPRLLAKGRRRGVINVVGTVYDFAAEKDDPARPWTLGGEEAWPLVDLLVGNEAEIVRYAGRAGVEEAVDSLLGRGLLAAAVTRGAGPVYYRSAGGVFGECQGSVASNSALAAMARDRAAHPGDTTGAGDNFLGGLLADFFRQLLSDDFYPKGELHLERELFHMNPLRLREAVETGVAAGGLACLQPGGVRLENTAGERLGQIRSWLSGSAVPA